MLSVYDLSKKTITAVVMLYKNTKAIVRSPGDNNFFDIVTRVLQLDTLAPYLFIICQDYVHQTSIDLINENSFTLEKGRSGRCPA